MSNRGSSSVRQIIDASSLGGSKSVKTSRKKGNTRDPYEESTFMSDSQLVSAQMRPKRDYIAMMEAQVEQEIHTEYEVNSHRNKPLGRSQFDEDDPYKYGTDNEVERAAVEKLSQKSIKLAQARTQAPANQSVNQ